MSVALLIDFGSTYTKLRAVDLADGRILGSGQGPSTVTRDVTIGMDAALSDLERRMGALPKFAHRLASSSAAGGLRMATVGLVKELTAEAARRAALGAGAKLVGAFSYRLNDADVVSLHDLKPDMILLAGGTDGGNSDVILHNARRLAQSGLACPVVLAGNRDASDECAATLKRGGLPVTVTGNVMPTFGELDIEPARAAIRQIFIDRIVHAKGIDKAADRFDAVLMPTPAAVMDGAVLLSEGTARFPGWGELMVIDIGGATTDVHTVASGVPSAQNVVQTGLPEPFVKRTVEGDLGMRHNAAAIAAAAGREAIAHRAGLEDERTTELLSLIESDVERLPQSDEEAALDAALAFEAVRLAVVRHAGVSKVVQTVHGPATLQTGKDLTGLGAVIGTGGILAHGAAPATILTAALADPSDPFSLRPRAPKLYIDQNYLLYAAGLLAQVDREAAMRMAVSTLKPVTANTNEDRHARKRQAV
ncbi:MAG: methylaspartate mutase accessory protein GlmL [Pseudomonadota bacterium]|nr:methylaspartate mutase accessory protein GlmL [Pseudomonadota bacterium]